MVPNATYMVWGSSLGWLLFYAAATFDVTCVGYELLATLADAAEQVRKSSPMCSCGWSQFTASLV
jgi:hypothetical protein